MAKNKQLSVEDVSNMTSEQMQDKLQETENIIIKRLHDNQVITLLNSILDVLKRIETNTFKGF